MKLDITRGIQKKGVDVPFDLVDSWGEDRWNGDTIAYVRPVAFSGTYMLADDTVLVRGTARARIQSPCARCLAPAFTDVTAEVDEAFRRDTGDRFGMITFAPASTPRRRPSSLAVPSAVVAGSSTFGFIRRTIASRKSVSSAVPAGSCANGVSWCGMNGPMPTICGAKLFMKSRSRVTSAVV